jgi:anti-sigma-K factor RskA
MTLAVHDLPRPTAGEFYYAWLLDPATDKMLALGLVSPGRDMTVELDDALVASYSAIDVSLEDDDGDPAHSVTSVLRGTYQPDQITTTERKPG